MNINNWLTEIFEKFCHVPTALIFNSTIYDQAKSHKKNTNGGKKGDLKEFKFIEIGVLPNMTWLTW